MDNIFPFILVKRHMREEPKW